MHQPASGEARNNPPPLPIGSDDPKEAGFARRGLVHCMHPT